MFLPTDPFNLITLITIRVLLHVILKMNSLSSEKNMKPLGYVLSASILVAVVMAVVISAFRSGGCFRHINKQIWI